MNNEAIKVFIDTDIGDDIDDAYALAYALLNPRFEVLGVTTVGHWPEDRLRIVDRLLSLTNKDAQFASGNPTKSTGFGPPVKSKQLAWSEANLPFPSSTSTDAARLLYETAAKYPYQVHLVTMGPLTNVAEAFYLYPDLPQLLGGVLIMGGELEIFRREHNFGGDYVAADAVLRKAPGAFLTTWSTGRKLRFSHDELDVFHARETQVNALLSDLNKAWSERHHPTLYDIIAFLYLEKPDVVETRQMRLRVETTGIYTRGVVVNLDAPAGIDLELCSVPNIDLQGGEAITATVDINVSKAKQMIYDVFGFPSRLKEDLK